MYVAQGLLNPARDWRTAKTLMLDGSILSLSACSPPSGISLSSREEHARVCLAYCRRFPTLAVRSLLLDRRFNMPVLLTVPNPSLLSVEYPVIISP